MLFDSKKDEHTTYAIARPREQLLSGTWLYLLLDQNSDLIAQLRVPSGNRNRDSKEVKTISPNTLLTCGI